MEDHRLLSSLTTTKTDEGGGEREEKHDQARIGILIEPNIYGQQRQRMGCVIHDDQIFRSIYDLRLLLSIFFPRYSILSLSLSLSHPSIHRRPAACQEYFSANNE